MRWFSAILLSIVAFLCIQSLTGCISVVIPRVERHIDRGDVIADSFRVSRVRNNFELFDTNGNVFRLTGLGREERHYLDRHEGRSIRAEIKVISIESRKAFNARLLRILDR
jgi:hypothetical protein